MSLRISVTDIETGDSDTAEVRDGDYILICAEPCRLAGTEVFANGTHRLSIIGRIEATK